MTAPIMILQHDDEVPPAVLAEVLSQRDAPHMVIRLDQGAAVPILGQGQWAAIVSLGGEMGAYDTDKYPYLVAEKKLLAAATDRRTPVLGICLGSQLLADAIGGRAYLAPRTEACLVSFGSGGVAPDPVVDQLDAPQLSFHRDTFDLPPQAKLLQASADYPLAFRLGTSIGIQTHPEIDPDVAQEWFATSEGKAMLEDSGADGAALVAGMRTASQRSAEAAHRFVDAWLNEVQAATG